MIYVLIGIFGLAGAFYVFAFFTALFERQYLVGDVEPTSQPYPHAPLPYWNATAQDAIRLGMIRGGEYATKRNTSPVKGLESLWITPDRQVIASIVCGSFAKLPLKKTTLTTRLADGRAILSIDNPLQPDPTGVTNRAVLLNAGIAEFMNFHRQRVERSGSAPVPFKNPSLLAELEQIELERGSRLVLMGLARWGEPQKHTIRGTFKGAIRQMIDSYVKMPHKLRTQSGRADIRRAGSVLPT